MGSFIIILWVASESIYNVYCYLITVGIGAQIGANFGSSRAFDNAKKEELNRLGVTKEMLEMAEDSGVALEQATEGLKAIRASYETQQQFSRRLDSDAEKLYDQAMDAMSASDEGKARDFLAERLNVQEKLKKALLACAEERKRVDIQERNVAALGEKAMEIDSLLRRGVGAKALQDTSFSLPDEDPLLRKFRDNGIN